MKPTNNSALDHAARCIQQTQRSIFLTGKAGTGKTTFLRQIVEQTHKNVMVVAPTGVAAINAGGATIHSIFQLPFGMFLPDALLRELPDARVAWNTPHTLIRHMQMADRKRSLLRELELLIIDEVSMLRADLLDAVDAVLRHVRRQPRRPFGGVQVLFIGDLLQLPPVVKPEEWQYLKDFYPSIYFFDARVLQDEKPLYIELETVYRQSDSRFLELLNRLRTNQLTRADVDLLNQYYRPGFETTADDPYITLTSHNYQADSINSQALAKLPGAAYTYDAEVDGDFPENAYPVDTELELRVGAQVMFVKNDPSGEQRFFNGKIGLVTELGPEHISVQCPGDPVPLAVELYTWKNVRYALNEDTGRIDEQVLGTFTQYPLKLAWAITVHKSQGLTFDKAAIDVAEAFASGQTYVALSRLRSIDGLVLLSRFPADGIRTDQAILDYTGSNALAAPEQEMLYKQARAQYLQQYLDRSFDLAELGYKFRQHRDSYTKDEMRSEKQQFKPWAEQLVNDLQPLLEVSQKFRWELEGLLAIQPGIAQAMERVGAAVKYFDPRLEHMAARIREQDAIVRAEKKTRKYQAELQQLEAQVYMALRKIRRSEKFIQAFAEDRELNRQSLEIEELNPDRLRNKQAADGVRPSRKRARSAGHEPDKAVEPKLPSKSITFQLYNEGLSVAAIAAQRGLAVTTIEGHLAEQVALGMIPADKLADPQHIANIIQVAKVLDSRQLTPIKQHLGDEYTFSEIRFALAQLAFLESQQSAESTPEA